MADRGVGRVHLPESHAEKQPAQQRTVRVPPLQDEVLTLQQQAGNRAVVQRLTVVSVQREETPKQRVAKAVEEGTPAAIAGLDNDALAAATSDERLKMIRILNEKGSSLQRVSLPRLWDGFGGQLRATADANAADWRTSFQVAPSLMRQSFNVMGQREMFRRDVVHVANDYLDQNEQYCKKEFARLGLTETGDVMSGPPTEAQAQSRKSMRDDAALLAADQEAMKSLRNVIVGYESVESTPGGTGKPVYVGKQKAFDPDRAPGHGPLETDKTMKTWDVVKQQYDALDLLIRARIMVNPTLFPLARGTPEDPAKAQKVAAGSEQDSQQTIGNGLKEVLANIARTRPMLMALAPDLQPIHGQLMAGSRVADPSRNWAQSPFYTTIAADIVEERKPGPWWQALGLAAAEFAAYVVAGLATGGTALAIGLAAKGAAQTALAVGKAQALQAAYGATTTEEMGLITEGQINHAAAEVIETTAFALLDTVLAVGAVRGALKEIYQFEKAAADAAKRASTAADKLIATEMAKDSKAASEAAKAGLSAVAADAEAAQKAVSQAEAAAAKATPEEAARANAAVVKAKAAAARADIAVRELKEVAEGKRVPRAAPVTDPHGLGSKASYDATVKAAKKEIGAAWKTMTAAQRQVKVIDVVEARMRAQGIPAFANVVHKPGIKGAAAEWWSWNLLIDPALLDGTHSMQDVIALVYHEAAHFEDFVNAARLKLGEGLSAAQVQALMNIESRGMQAAVAKGALRATDAEFGRATSIFESVWGANKGARDAIYRTKTLAQLDYELEELRLWGVVDKSTGQLLPGKTVSDLQAVQAQLQTKATSYRNAIRAYEKLPEEVQAYGVQEGLLRSFEGEAFRKKILAIVAAIAAAGGSAAALKAIVESDK